MRILPNNRIMIFQLKSCCCAHEIIIILCGQFKADPLEIYFIHPPRVHLLCSLFIIIIFFFSVYLYVRSPPIFLHKSFFSVKNNNNNDKKRRLLINVKQIVVLHKIQVLLSCESCINECFHNIQPATLHIFVQLCVILTEKIKKFFTNMNHMVIRFMKIQLLKYLLLMQCIEKVTAE